MKHFRIFSSSRESETRRTYCKRICSAVFHVLRCKLILCELCRFASEIRRIILYHLSDITIIHASGYCQLLQKHKKGFYLPDSDKEIMQN
jgi:hypothetical protein